MTTNAVPALSYSEMRYLERVEARRLAEEERKAGKGAIPRRPLRLPSGTPRTPTLRERHDARQRRYRSGWNVYLSTPGRGGSDRLVREGLSEDEARALVCRLNAELPPVTRAPFPFYFCHHGNHGASVRDAGLDGWIDGQASSSAEEEDYHDEEEACPR